MALDWIKSIRKTDTCALTIDLGKIYPGFKQTFMFTSDNHSDHPMADLRMEERHLKEAILNDYGIINLGDLHCAMQGKGDPRGSKASIRAELKTRAYWDSLTDFMVERYGEYADRWIAQLYGNHELGVLEKNEIDLIQRFAACMNSQYSGIVETLGYSGFINIRAKVGGNSAISKTIYGSHGFCSGGKMTQGVASSMRQNVNVDGVDVIISGHSHNSFYVDYKKEYLNRQGRICEKSCFLLQIPTYKDGQDRTRIGWEAKRGIGAKPKGCWLMHVYYIAKGELGLSFERRM